LGGYLGKDSVVAHLVVVGEDLWKWLPCFS